jgi:methionyl-tRNA formyltransferase
LNTRRLVLFFDSSIVLSSLLVEAALEAVNRRRDVNVVGICDTARKGPQDRILCTLRRVLAHGSRWFFNPEIRESKGLLILPWLHRIVRRFGVPVLQIPGGEINDSQFIHYLREEIRPAGALSFFCLEIFKAPLLDVLEVPVNYHNGLLPKYGGLSATAWSMYCGEKETGFTFHRMNEKIDGGDILLTGSIPIQAHSTLRGLEWEKTLKASRHIPRVLDLMWEKTTGTPQKEKASYFDQQAGQAMVNIDTPSRYPADELLKRIRCFQMLNIKIGSRYYPVTHLERVEETDDSPRPLEFFTSDGIRLRANRFKFLPIGLYRFSRALLGEDMDPKR